MTLDDFMRKEKWTNRYLSKHIDRSEECVRLWRAGQRRPFPYAAEQIVQLTAGQVTRADLMQAYEQRKNGKHVNGKLGLIRDHQRKNGI